MAAWVGIQRVTAVETRELSSTSHPALPLVASRLLMRAARPRCAPRRARRLARSLALAAVLDDCRH
eukprot:6526887-Prymnesium_polylepis.1